MSFYLSNLKYMYEMLIKLFFENRLHWGYNILYRYYHCKTKFLILLIPGTLRVSLDHTFSAKELLKSYFGELLKTSLFWEKSVTLDSAHLFR